MAEDSGRWRESVVCDRNSVSGCLLIDLQQAGRWCTPLTSVMSWHSADTPSLQVARRSARRRDKVRAVRRGY